MVFLGATRTMAMQSAKARIPLIKFRYGNRQAANQSAPAAATPAPGGQACMTASSPHGPSVTIHEQQLPARFFRQPISEEEIEYINRGGPA